VTDRDLLLRAREALACAEYAMSHPASNQQFALDAVHDCLTSLDARLAAPDDDVAVGRASAPTLGGGSRSSPEPVPLTAWRPIAEARFDDRHYLAFNAKRGEIHICDFDHDNDAEWMLRAGYSHWMPLPAEPGAASTAERPDIRVNGFGEEDPQGHYWIPDPGPGPMVMVPREIVANYLKTTEIPRHRRICEAALKRSDGGDA